MNTPRNLCVLFGDVSGSTRLYEKLGDAEALRAVERCLNRMERAASAYRGRVVKTIGDELMLVFENAEQGCLAACDMQQRVDALPPVSGVKLAIRIGFHFGPAIEEGGDVFGDTVNTAARMAGLAKGGQIITSGETMDTLPGLLKQSTRELDALAVKGKAEEVRIVEVIWQESGDLTMLAENRSAPAADGPALKLRHGSKEIQLGPDRPAVSMGRDTHCDIIIRDPRASRSHGRIERRRGKYYLVDQSTNGTYVTLDGEAEFVLKREEALLRGKGRIAFGHGAADEGAEVVEFQVG
ncbi:MAG: adenylate/guanylate cyclase domain-containing protein [Rhodocyclaceae bacterium]|nr:adenylate/guanylate cyclase domain-containing protein [Rhodocyclaceae bacterium]